MVEPSNECYLGQSHLCLIPVSHNNNPEYFKAVLYFKTVLVPLIGFKVAESYMDSNFK